MAITPIKVLLFLLGGTVAGGGTAYMTGVFDPVNPPATLAAVDPAPKGDRTQPPEVKPLTPAEVGVTAPALPADADVPAMPPAVAAAPADAAPANSGEAVTPPAAADANSPTLPAEEAPAPPVVAAAPADAAPANSGEAVTPPAGADAAADPAKPAEPAAEPAPKIAALDPAESQPQPAAPAMTQPAEAAAPTQPGVQPPGFDLMRVEVDGSIVIAGHAAASAKVEAIIGSRLIGSAIAGPEGDFAIVIDQPLKPGDYQIVLRATGPDGVVAMSLETAVVSIPETAEGQVLALVEQPGKPAELITVPQPAPAAVPVEPATADVAAAEPTAPAADAAIPPQAAAAVPTSETPAAAGETQAGPATQPADQQIASAPAEVPAFTQPAETPVAPGGDARIVVEAVEIEGRRIFVAGSADAGVRVRAYANDILLGETMASAERRFLVEAERDLPVGDYIIRVDALGRDGVKVIARAAVPFQREPGENLAAVAPAAPSTDQVAIVTAPRAALEAPAAAFVTPAAPLADPPVAVAEPAAPAAPKDGAATTTDQAAGADAPKTAPAADPALETSQPAPAADPAKPASERVTANEPAAPATDASAAPGSSDIASAPAVNTAAPAVEAPVPPALVMPATPANGMAAAIDPVTEIAATELPADASDPTAAPGEVLAPKLEPVNGSVIIRRGDSLWRISRRVYGRGVRYSTIYLANQPQIRDPNRIYPGQIFGVPTKTTEGEAADMKGLGEQAVQAAPTAPATTQ